MTFASIHKQARAVDRWEYERLPVSIEYRLCVLNGARKMASMLLLPQQHVGTLVVLTAMPHYILNSTKILHSY